MTEKTLILVGAGGHARSVSDAATDAGLTVLGVLERDASSANHNGLSVIGTDDDIPALASEALFINCLGQTAAAGLRRKVSDRISANGATFGTVIARDAYVSSTAYIGVGTVVLHRAIINAGAKVGAQCIINTGAIIEHDTVIEDFCHISTGAIVNGGAFVGDGCMVGSGAVIKHGVRICRNTVIGAGAIVVKDISEPGTYVGVPAKKIK